MRGWSVQSSAINSLSIEVIDKYVGPKISHALWTVALNTNNLDIINHIWTTRKLKIIPGLIIRACNGLCQRLILSCPLINELDDSSIYDTVINSSDYRACFEKIYQLGCHPSDDSYNKVFASKYVIDQITWFHEHGVAIDVYNGNSCGAH